MSKVIQFPNKQKQTNAVTSNKITSGLTMFCNVGLFITGINLPGRHIITTNTVPQMLDYAKHNKI